MNVSKEEKGVLSNTKKKEKLNTLESSKNYYSAKRTRLKTKHVNKTS